MRIETKKSGKKVFLAVAAVALIVGGGSIGYLYYVHTTKKSVNNQTASTQNINLDAPSQDQVKAGSDQKQSTIESSKDDANSNPTPTDNTLYVTVTASNNNNGIQQLRYLISKQISGGTCTLTLTNGQQSIVKTANVQPLASSSTCQGFDINTSDLASGQWTASLVVTNGGQSGSVTSTFGVQ